MYKNGHFSTFFFLGNIGQENVFYDILERKKAFLGFKNEKFKNSEIGIFPKRLSHGFGPKMAIFRTFYFLSKRGQKNVFYKILEQKKNAFLGYKNKNFKKSKNCHFSKEVNSWFWSKNGHFFSFLFFGNIGQKNVFYNILERKNAFLGFKNEKFKKLKIGIFTKRLTSGFGPKMAVCPTFFFRQNRQGKMSFTTF